MPLPTTNISISLVKTDLNITDNNLTTICQTPNQNPYSFYGSGNPDVDVNKDIYWLAPTTNNKLGDFRSYDKNATTPSTSDNFTQKWGPGGTNVTFIMPWFSSALNIQDITLSASHVTQKYYLTSTDRLNETNLYYSEINTIDYNTITPLIGHSRNTTKRANSTQIPQTDFPTSGLSSPTDTIYADTYLSDLSGQRLVNLPTLTGGYTTITFTESQQPKLTSGSTIPNPPSGITVALVEIFTTSSPLCNTDTDIQQIIGSTNVTFYIHIKGIASPNKILGSSSCDVNLYLNGQIYTLYTGSLSHSSNTYISYTLPVSWKLDDVGTVEIENNTWSGLTTNC